MIDWPRTERAQIEMERAIFNRQKDGKTLREIAADLRVPLSIIIYWLGKK